MAYRLWEINREPVKGLKLDDCVVAWADDRKEIMHYAMIYSQDGPIKIEEKVNGKWKLLTSAHSKEDKSDGD